MFFHTKSMGVRRLSIILAIIAGCYLVATAHTPIYAGEGRLYWNLFNMALLFSAGFVAAWLTVRIIAWIIEGFIRDRTGGL
jgi:hypothetical protein